MYKSRHKRVKAFLVGIDEYLDSRKVQRFRPIKRTDTPIVHSKLLSKHPNRSRQKKAKQFKNKIAKLEDKIQILEQSITYIKPDLIGRQHDKESLHTYKLQKK
ncbi:MAG: hypothetical protein ABI045_02200 [Flavobacteriales bacterium]